MLHQLELWDQAIFLWLNGLHADWLDGPMQVITNKLTWIPLYALCLYALWRAEGLRIWQVLLAVALLIAATDQTASSVFKPLVSRLRPCNEPALAGLVHTVDGKCSGAPSFFSSHASNSMGLALFLTLWLGRSWRWLAVALLFWAFLHSYSRIYLGLHYPGDILAGWLCGASFAVFLYRVAKKLLRNETSSTGVA